MPEPERNKLEAKITDTEPYKKLVKMLRRRYYTTETEEKRKCDLCGKQKAHLRKMSNGLFICEDCKNSEVTSIGMAAELLYTTYGNFKRLFPNIRFRYPDLEISELSMYRFTKITHGSPDMSGLLEVVNSRDEDFSIRIAKDIPYGFLEELYAQAFSKQLDKDSYHQTDGKKKWSDYMKEYLVYAGRWQQAQLLS